MNNDFKRAWRQKSSTTSFCKLQSQISTIIILGTIGDKSETQDVFARMLTNLSMAW